MDTYSIDYRSQHPGDSNMIYYFMSNVLFLFNDVIEVKVKRELNVNN
jgi:hypothetical protein